MPKKEKINFVENLGEKREINSKQMLYSRRENKN